MRKFLLGCVGACIVGLLFFWASRSVDPVSTPAPSSRTAPAASPSLDPRVSGPLLQPTEDAARSGAAPGADPVVASEPLDLRAVLIAIAGAEASGDERRLETLLTRIVGDRALLSAVLQILESPDARASAVVRRGGVVCIAVAFARWSRENAPGEAATSSFCEAVLQSLPRQPAETRDLLIAFLVGSDLGEFPAIPGSLLPAILSLCRQHPEEAASYARLLERLGQDPLTLANHRAELVALILEGRDLPLVEPALRALLALDPASGVAGARALLAEAARGSELHALIVKSIAAAAPPSVAVEVLVSAADGSEFAAFEELGRRPEAREEVRDQYSALVAADIDVRARRILVASMGREETGTLLGIADTDPNLDVRRQAFLTATVTRDVGLEGLQAVRAAYARGGTSGGIDARCAAVSAGNVVLRSTGATRDGAIGLLGEIARDDSVPADDRRLALTKLRPHVPRESLADLESLDPPAPRSQ